MNPYLSMKELLIIVVFGVLYLCLSGPVGAQPSGVQCELVKANAAASCFENGGSSFMDSQGRLVCRLDPVDISATFSESCVVVKAEIVDRTTGEKTVVISN